MDLNLNFDDSMQHEYEFKKFIDLERIRMNEEHFISLSLDVTIKKASISLKTAQSPCLCSLLFSPLSVKFIDKGTKELKLSSHTFFLLLPSSNSLLTAILSPLSSKYTLQRLDLLSTTSKSPHFSLSMITQQNGDKSISTTIEKVKFIVRPYILRKLMGFFTEAMPDYDFSLDKPNGYYKRNGEVASKDPNSKLTFILEIRKSYFIMAHDLRSDKAVIMEGLFNVNFHRENYEVCKGKGYNYL
jgi:hypothetical protein